MLVGVAAAVEHGAMRPRRFKAETLDDAIVTLDEAQSRHAVTVLRLNPGETVTLFDGAGQEAVGEIVDARGDGMTVRIVSRRIAKPTSGGLTLVVATPKGERADWMVEKCAELGVRAIVPLLCERGHVTPGDGKIRRWRRKADEAAKQSEQSVTMSVGEPATLSAMLQNKEQGALLFVADPCAESTIGAALRSASHDARSMIFIGPEGGFSDDELKTLCDAGANPVRLAESILRIETAAVAAASIWAAWRADIAGE